MLWAVVIAFVVSGLGSYFLLNRQREALARRVDERARRDDGEVRGDAAPRKTPTTSEPSAWHGQSLRSSGRAAALDPRLRRTGRARLRQQRHPDIR